MNVSVPTKKVIAQLEKKLTELKNVVAASEAWQVELKKWRENVVKELVSAKDWSITDKTFRDWKGENKVEVTFRIPEKLMKLKPKDVHGNAYDAERAIPDIEQALRVLKMTDDETVSASTFKSLSKFL